MIIKSSLVSYEGPSIHSCVCVCPHWMALTVVHSRFIRTPPGLRTFILINISYPTRLRLNLSSIYINMYNSSNSEYSIRSYSVFKLQCVLLYSNIQTWKWRIVPLVQRPEPTLWPREETFICQKYWDVCCVKITSIHCKDVSQYFCQCLESPCSSSSGL